MLTSPKNNDELRKGEVTLRSDDNVQTHETTNYSENRKEKKPRAYLEPSLDIAPQIWPFVL